MAEREGCQTAPVGGRAGGGRRAASSPRCSNGFPPPWASPLLCPAANRPTLACCENRGPAGGHMDSDDNEGLSELHKVGVTNGPGADVSCRNKADASARSERVATDAG